MGPMLVPEDLAGTRLVGYVRMGGAEHKLRIAGIRRPDPADPTRADLGHARVQAEPPLAALLAGHEELLKIRMKQATSVEGFMGELEELIRLRVPLATATSASTPASLLPSATFYRALLEEISTIGWSRVGHLSDDLCTLELRTHDAAERVHSIRLTLTAEYPSSPPVCAVDAPEDFVLTWPSTPPRGLQTVLAQFETFLGKFQGFWNALDDIDGTCCVLEPHRPTRATGRRRLAVQRHVSVQIEVHPERPRGLCELRFFGSEAAIAPLRERWTERLLEWEDERPVAANLERLLEVELPSPTTTKPEEFALECGICYCYRLDTVDEEGGTMIPDSLCENPKCHRPFHEKCLFAWLKALPTARQSFNTVFGECPYCREAISAKFIS